SQTQSGAYALVLGEANGNRRLPIIIGAFEAQAIAIELEQIKPARPLTRDLFRSLCDSFDINVREVVIYNLQEGILYAQIVCDDAKRIVEIDSRTSDAIAIAVRFGCTVYTYEFILATAGIVVSDDESEAAAPETQAESKPGPSPTLFDKMSLEQLEKLLNKAIEEEHYE